MGLDLGLRGRGLGRWGQAGNPGVAIRTLNGMDLTDSIAESVAEAGNPGYSLIHPGHGAMEAGLSAGKGTGHSPSPSLISEGPAGCVYRAHLS